MPNLSINLEIQIKKKWLGFIWVQGNPCQKKSGASEIDDFALRQSETPM